MKLQLFFRRHAEPRSTSLANPTQKVKVVISADCTASMSFISTSTAYMLVAILTQGMMLSEPGRSRVKPEPQPPGH